MQRGPWWGIEKPKEKVKNLIKTVICNIEGSSTLYLRYISEKYKDRERRKVQLFINKHSEFQIPQLLDGAHEWAHLQNS